MNVFKKAFTMAELIIALVIVSILAAVTIGIAKTKMAKVDKYSYYVAYSTMQDIAANIISQSEYDVDENGLASVSIYDNKYIANNSPGYKYYETVVDLGGNFDFGGTVELMQCIKPGMVCGQGRPCCGGTCSYSTNPPTCPTAGGSDNGGQMCAAIANCDTYVEGKCQCAKCKSGYKLSGFQCVCNTSKPENSSYTATCGWTCNSGYKQNGNSCVYCPDPRTLSGGQCVCASGNWDGSSCVSCSGGQSWNSSTKKCECSGSAPSNATMNTSNCTWSCNSGYEKIGNACYENCPSGKVRNGTACVCSGSKPSHSSYTSTCGWTCDSGYEKIDNACYENCPSGKVRNGTACVCSGSKPAHSSYTSNCGWTCDSGYEKIDNACYENCPSNKQRSGTSCVCKNSAPANAYLNSDCSWSCNSGYEKIGDACYQNCPSNKKRSGTTCVCKNSAPSNGTLDSDCNPVCNKGYELKGSTCKIIVNCGANEQKTAEGTCECKAGYERAGDGTCLQICSATQYRDETTKACKDCTDSPTWAEYQSVASCSEHVDDTVCQRYGMRYSETKGTCVMKKTAENLCERIKAEYNISGSACNITADQMTSAVQNGFKGQNPHIKMANGTSLYIASDLVKLNELSDAQDVNDRVAYLVYVDVNGDAKGKGTLYQDVFPFYLTMSGKVIPAYDSTVESGGSSAEHLSLNVLYDEYTADGKRVVKAADTNKDFHTAACETGYIRSAKYCGTISPIEQCSDPQKDCRFIVNKPMKFFR